MAGAVPDAAIAARGSYGHETEGAVDGLPFRHAADFAPMRKIGRASGRDRRS